MLELWAITERVALPLAMLLVVILSGSRGIWVWRREIDREREVSKVALERERESGKVAADLCETRRQEAQKRADHYEAVALRALTGAERSTATAERTVEAVKHALNSN